MEYCFESESQQPTSERLARVVAEQLAAASRRIGLKPSDRNHACGRRSEPGEEPQTLEHWASSVVGPYVRASSELVALAVEAAPEQPRIFRLLWTTIGSGEDDPAPFLALLAAEALAVGFARSVPGSQWDAWAQPAFEAAAHDDPALAWRAWRTT